MKPNRPWAVRRDDPHPLLVGKEVRAKAIKLLGISEEEWYFTTGRYLEARLELEKLRGCLKRVAQSTRDEAIIAEIPHDDAERGWNRLCAIHCDFLDQVVDQPMEDE